MNKYKVVSIVLAFGLLASLVRLFVPKAESATDKRTAVLENILSRKSVREYTSEKLHREQLDSLVRMGMAAPSSKDMRPWQFYIVDDPKLLQALGEAHPHGSVVKLAPAAIVVCGDTTVTDDDGNPSRAWVNDCSAATQNILLAAEAMGLGAVWTAAWPYENTINGVREVLEMPEGIIPLAVVAVGKPKGEQKPKDKWDKDLIHYNKAW